MAEELKVEQANLNAEGGEGEVRDRGLFDFVHKKKEEENKVQAEDLVTAVEKIQIEEAEKKKHGLIDKLHRSHSSSSSSSDEEEIEGEKGAKEKTKKKKKELKEKLHESENNEKKEEKKADSAEEKAVFEESALPPEEGKKGILEKIKEKLPGHGKKSAEESGVEHVKEEEGTEGKEKKGILGKIMEKIPGYHKNAGEEAEKSH